ncbi:MAG: DUF21 domain-containing protein, partial [Nitrospirae bacterium]
MESIPIGTPDAVTGIIAIIICILVVAFLSSSEASLISVNRIRIRNLSEKGNKKAETVKEILS